MEVMTAPSPGVGKRTPNNVIGALTRETEDGPDRG